MNFIKHLKLEKKQILLHGFGYIAASAIAFIHIIPSSYMLKIVGALIPISILILFVKIIVSNLKTNIKDIAITFFGVCYIVLFLIFIPIIRENLEHGKFLIWFLFFSAWGTDVFAYIAGKNFGKHKFCEISPNKTIEGCIGGTIGAVLLVLAYTVVCNRIWNFNFEYTTVIFISTILSILSQIGDLSASSIKRYTGVKDFSNLIPGHGGMLDRIDSIIFIAPFAYFLLMLI